jgi:hypothetical protein
MCARAIQVRLERLLNGPQKDQAKAAQVVPFWQGWLKHHERLRARGVPPEELDAFRLVRVTSSLTGMEAARRCERAGVLK